MGSKKNYLWMKSISCIILLVMLVINRNGFVGNEGIAYGGVLIYMINSFGRMHISSGNIRKRTSVILFSISIFIDGAMLAYFGFRFGIFSFIIAFPLIIEVIFFYEKAVALGITAGLLGEIIFISIQGGNVGITERIFYTACVVMYAMVSVYIKDMDTRKLKAHELYDELRISQEKLKKANLELQNYSKTIEELTVLRERTRVSRELHDSVGHSLSTLCIQLKAVDTLIEKKPSMASDMMKKNIQYVESTLDSVRRTVRDMKPKELEVYEGIMALEHMIKAFSERTDIDVKLIISKEKWALNSERSHNIYRIIQESLSNSLRHGKATRITVSLQFLNDRMYLNIKDNGVGAEDLEESFGLKGIEDRVRNMMGEVTYETGKCSGFSTSLWIPKLEV